MSFNWYYFLFIQPNGITSVHYRHIKITLHYKSLPVELKLRSRDTFLLFSRHAGRPLFLSWFVFVIFCQFAIDFVHFFLDGTLVLSKVHVPMKQPWTIFTIFTSYPAHYNNIPQYHKLEACWMQQDPSGSNTKNERSFVLCLVQQNPTKLYLSYILLSYKHSPYLTSGIQIKTFAGSKYHISIMTGVIVIMEPKNSWRQMALQL